MSRFVTLHDSLSLSHSLSLSLSLSFSLSPLYLPIYLSIYLYLYLSISISYLSPSLKFPMQKKCFMTNSPGAMACALSTTRGSTTEDILAIGSLRSSTALVPLADVRSIEDGPKGDEDPDDERYAKKWPRISNRATKVFKGQHLQCALHAGKE